ncbi:glycerate kinase [Rhodococcus sp. YH3-3]|uniref:glycerate kinase family protein n=1 Tax=Rhodococcus sp. YH3-3 TaxID=1803579 RepID=UPI0007DB4DFC|nr:glycerate kinase [Rhodococcus sp. YH3-3]
MRVIVAPDSFGETLTAVAAAESISAGWRRGRPGDDVVIAPQSDGGPGFVDVLATAGGDIRTARVSGPLTAAVDATWLFESDTAYIESAEAVGLGLLGGPPTRDTALAAHSRGVGELIAVALEAGVKTVVVGLGGSCCTDGGRGLVEALGDLEAATAAMAGIQLVAATDVEHVLLGEHGAAAVFGPQKGADAEAVAVLEASNGRWAEQLESVTGKRVSNFPGAGAAGGIGAALFALGAQRRSGADVVADRTGQAALLASADLVITGEGKFDHQSLRGKLVTTLASAGAAHGVPTLVFAGQVTLDEADYASTSIVAAKSVTDFAGSVERAMEEASACLEGLAEHTAREWNFWRGVRR